jgi:hypothetical protein
MTNGLGVLGDWTHHGEGGILREEELEICVSCDCFAVNSLTVLIIRPG